MPGGAGDLAAVLERARSLGFLGPGPVGRHVDQAEAFVAAVDAPPSRLLDLGSGGGVPGLLLALRWPGTAVDLLEVRTRRIDFLGDVVAELDLTDRVEVVPGRAEEVARLAAYRHRYDVVTARSFGAPAVTAECGAPFLATSGVLLVAEPPGGASGRWPAEGLAQLGLVDDGLVAAAAGTVRRLRAEAACGDRYPRRVGVPAKDPLF
jgi:16S rRNA (guanine527-N7)-methyltransferase